MNTLPLNGTYFHKELAIFQQVNFLQKIDAHIGGINNIAAVSNIILGLPLLSTRATPGTLIASKHSRRILNITLARPLPTSTNKSINVDRNIHYTEVWNEDQQHNSA